MISVSTPACASLSAASMAMRQQAPYVTMVTSLPSRMTSGTPRGTVISPILPGSLSFDAIAIEHLNDHGWLVRLQEGVVEAGGACHVSRHQDVHSPQETQQARP